MLISLLPAVRPQSGAALAGLFRSGVGEMVKIAVFIDWQNAYKTAREAFGLQSQPNELGNFSPYRLSRLLAASNGRGVTRSDLVCVEIHRGLPSQKHDRVGYAANRRQAAAWVAENPAVVKPRLRPLRYPRSYPAEPAVEKGVDVQLAVSAIEATLTGRCDVAIVFSHDTDLLPVPETIARLVGADRVETAGWASPTFRRRLRPNPEVIHHPVSEAVFRAVETPVNYARG